MEPDTEVMSAFLKGCIIGLVIGFVFLLLVSLIGCTVATVPSKEDAGEDAAIHEVMVPQDAGADTRPNVKDICCVIDTSHTACGEELRGCVFTCGKAANGLTDVPWLCGKSASSEDLFGCQDCQYGFWCHTVDGDGVVSHCE